MLVHDFENLKFILNSHILTTRQFCRLMAIRQYQMELELKHLPKGSN